MNISTHCKIIRPISAFFSFFLNRKSRSAQPDSVASLGKTVNASHLTVSRGPHRAAHQRAMLCQWLSMTKGRGRGYTVNGGLSACSQVPENADDRAHTHRELQVPARRDGV